MRSRSWRVARLALALGSVLIAVVPGVAGSGCEVATAPPADARPMAVLPSYARWWSEVEACSRLTGDLTRVDWFEVQADSADGGFALSLRAAVSVAHPQREIQPERGERVVRSRSDPRSRRLATPS